MMLDKSCHCVNYFGYTFQNKLKLVCCIADDSKAIININSTEINISELMVLPSLTARNTAFHLFEREIHEKFGLNYPDHPWLKPVRNPYDRFDLSFKFDDYPFYNIDSEELHEVGVGPIHAGVIEPGHFRFICKGEKILHLEIQLGYQHRSIENLFLSKNNLLQRNILAESIAGDTVAGHTTAFAALWESLCDYQPSKDIQFTRVIALELERIAIHTGDLSALCGDIAYQLGASVYGRLRTPVINFFQSWCGNRLAKSLIRAGKNQYPFTKELSDSLQKILITYSRDFEEITDKFLHHAGSLSRLEKTGVVSLENAHKIGTVGVTARASGLVRDIRSSHPFYQYQNMNHQPAIKNHGDVYSRTQMRREEIRQSLNYILELIKTIPAFESTGNIDMNPQPDSFAISLVEGWRGEICHTAITDESGNLICYKIKDPSFHNWQALALSVRKNEISDFPICNKSFNLSYCGFDL